MGSLVDRTGLRYGDLVVLRRDTSKPSAANGRRVYWLCQCDCGAQKSITGHELGAGDVRSCGCKHWVWVGEQKITHGHNRPTKGNPTRTYMSWQAAKERCHNPRNTKYPVYGARGINVCDRWRHSFENFLSDMGESPPGMTLDRKDNSLGYSPDNCRWATRKQQAINRAVTHQLDWRGQPRTITEIAHLEGIPRTTLNKRFARLRDINAAVQETRAKLRKFTSPGS